MKIGFVGLGIMGRPMAHNLIKGGHTVTVWARRAESMQPLLDAGAIGATGPADAARGNELVISMVADAPDVAEVMRGVASAAEPGLVAVDMSTIAPAAARKIGEDLAVAGVDFIDAPVSGGEVGAIAGTLSIMAGGSARSRPCSPQWPGACRPSGHGPSRRAQCAARPHRARRPRWRCC